MHRFHPKSYRPKGFLPKAASGLGRSDVGSVLFPCHKFKDPNIVVGLSDCLHCPYGDHWQDWDGDGWEECYYQWQDDLERQKQLEAERAQERRDFEEFLKRNEEQNKVLQEMWAREVAEHEALKMEMEEREKKEAKLKERLQRMRGFGTEGSEGGLERPPGVQ